MLLSAFCSDFRVNNLQKVGSEDLRPFSEGIVHPRPLRKQRSMPIAKTLRVSSLAQRGKEPLTESVCNVLESTALALSSGVAYRMCEIMI